MCREGKKNLGYTLIETVVAFAVLASALAGPISLVIRALYSTSYAKNKIIAVNLAQEGIELVRVIRDNNIICLTEVPGWKAAHNWKTGDGGGPTSSIVNTILQRADAMDVVNYNCGTISIKNPSLHVDAGCADVPLRLSDGTYGYISGIPTAFARCVSVRDAPVSEGGPGGGVIPANDIIDIISTVTWKERGNMRTFTLTERLYNW